MSAVTLERPWLTFDLGEQMQVLSWAINRPGFVMANQIVWREVCNADLPRDLDVVEWFGSELKARDVQDAVAFLTSRDVAFFHDKTVCIDETEVRCVATVGLSNAERIGNREDRSTMDWGTINVAVRVNEALSQTALIEMMSIATQARTAAIMDAGVRVSSGVATGTGTDCIAVAAPCGTVDYVGLHTQIGETVGAAAYAATAEGAMQWKADIALLLAQAAEAGKTNDHDG